MSNIFASKKSASNDVEDDYVGGGGAIDSDIYTAKIKTAYTSKAAKSDADSFNLILEINGREVRQQIWVSNRSGGLTYKDKKTGEEKNLPGYNLVSSLTMLVASKDLGEMDVEKLTFNLWDFEAKKEMPQAVDCFSELHGEMIQVALQRQTVDKTKLIDGKYQPTGDTRDINEIVKFFPEEKLVTISDVSRFVESLGGNFHDVLNARDVRKAIAKMDESQSLYAPKWLSQNQGKTYDKSTGKGTAEGKSFSKPDGAAKSSAPVDLFAD
jgi:dimeric dUTPase (all-alpha-NTP-PPase superfamily)